MTKLKISLAIFLMLSLLSGSAMGRKVPVFKFEIFAQKFAAVYQTGNVDALLQMYAPSVTVNGQILTREQLRPMLLKGVKSPDQSGSFRMVSRTGSLNQNNGFREIGSEKFSGKATFQISYTAGKTTKTLNFNPNWTVSISADGQDWQIVETDMLFCSWD